MIEESLKKCDIDTRVTLKNSMLLAGGN